MTIRSASLLVALLLSACSAATPRPADFESPLSSQTDEPMTGFGGEGGGLRRTPILFVHGNTESAHYWLPARETFLAEGWTPDELWAFSYGRRSVRAFDSNDLAAPAIGRMVDALTAHLSKKTGRDVRQVDIVAHSLGVTAVRQWMKQDNAWHRVRTLVAVAGANHGVWTARHDARGVNRVSALELAPGSPWLEQLNDGGETPGPTRYLTLYDGSGWGDVLFPTPHEHSPRLEGAINLAYNVEHGTYLDHRELARVPETVAVIADFLRSAGEPLPQAERPSLVREGDLLRAQPATAELACTSGTDYPNRGTPARDQIRIEPGALQTCYARDRHSGLSSAMQRFGAGVSSGEPLSLHADPPAGPYADPLRVALRASDPNSYIVYSTTGSAPQTGSPLYRAPIYVPGPLVLRAVAIGADGRRSPELRMRYDVHWRHLVAQHSLQRQLEADVPPSSATVNTAAP